MDSTPAIQELSDKLDGITAQITVNLTDHIKSVNDSLSKDIIAVRDGLSGDLANFNERLDALEGEHQNFSTNQQAGDLPQNKGSLSNPRAFSSHALHGAALSPANASASASEDIETQYSRVKDLVSRTSIDKDYDVPSAKKNIKKPDHSAVDIISKCGGYSTTALKVLATFNPESDCIEELVTYLYTISVAQVRYLQNKYGTMSVKGNFDDSTSRMFDMLENNSLRLNERAQGHLETAARLSAVRVNTGQQTQQPQQQQRNHYNGRYEGRYNNKNNNFNQYRNQDNYSNFSKKQFPPRRQGPQDSASGGDGANKE